GHAPRPHTRDASNVGRGSRAVQERPPRPPGRVGPDREHARRLARDRRQACPCARRRGERRLRRAPFALGRAQRALQAARLIRSAPMAETLRTEDADGVRSIVLTRAAEYNTITPALRDELAAAIDEADNARDVRVILLRAEGPAFCAGYGLDWSTQGPVDDTQWDSVRDMRMMGRFVDTYMKLWYARKPTIAAVQGWCIAGGTDMVLCCDLIVAGESAVFGYPPSRVWGTPTTAMWVYRMGLERAKRYLLTGDEIPAREAERIGLIGEVVHDDLLAEHAMELAKRMAHLPESQLVMLKLLC